MLFRSYLIRQPEGAGLYDVPDVVDVTEYFPSDYRVGFGIRKLGRFGYERKPGNFWTGDQNVERQNALIAPTSAVQGWEYLFHFEKERRRGEEWENQRYFLRHTGKYHIVKLESRFQGAYDFNYNKELENLNVVLILGESLRADHLHINGYKRQTTPNLEKIKNCYSKISTDRLNKYNLALEHNDVPQIKMNCVEFAIIPWIMGFGLEKFGKNIKLNQEKINQYIPINPHRCSTIGV